MRSPSCCGERLLNLLLIHLTLLKELVDQGVQRFAEFTHDQLRSVDGRFVKRPQGLSGSDAVQCTS